MKSFAKEMDKTGRPKTNHPPRKNNIMLDPRLIRSSKNRLNDQTETNQKEKKQRENGIHNFSLIHSADKSGTQDRKFKNTHQQIYPEIELNLTQTWNPCPDPSVNPSTPPISTDRSPFLVDLVIFQKHREIHKNKTVEKWKRTSCSDKGLHCISWAICSSRLPWELEGAESKLIFNLPNLFPFRFT